MRHSIPRFSYNIYFLEIYKKCVNLNILTLVKGWISFHGEFRNPFSLIPFWGGKSKSTCVIPNSHPAGTGGPMAGAGNSFQGRVKWVRSVLRVLTHSCELCTSQGFPEGKEALNYR